RLRRSTVRNPDDIGTAFPAKYPYLVRGYASNGGVAARVSIAQTVSRRLPALCGGKAARPARYASHLTPQRERTKVQSAVMTGALQISPNHRGRAPVLPSLTEGTSQRVERKSHRQPKARRLSFPQSRETFPAQT